MNVMWTNSICRKLNEPINVTSLKEHKGTCICFSFNECNVFTRRFYLIENCIHVNFNAKLLDRVAWLNSGTKSLYIMPLKTQFFLLVSSMT